MGWLIERPGTDGKTLYMAVFRDLHGRQRSAGSCTSRKPANKAWQKAEAELDAGKVGDPRRGRQTLAAYVTTEWYPNHVIELSTREGYTYVLDRYILPELGTMRMRDFLPFRTREWISTLQSKYGLRPPSIVKCKVVFDAIFTTAFNDQIVAIHPGKGVKTPAVAQKTLQIITPEQFDTLYCSFEDDTLRLLLETDIESGLRWGELTELRPKDINFSTGLLTVSRAVVQLKAKKRPNGQRFVVKNYPKDKEWRQLRLPDHLLDKLKDHIASLGVADDDLLFQMQQDQEARRRTRPESLPNPDTLGMTEPNEKGRIYQHGTTSAYNAARCRCQHCKDAIAAYRATRRAAGRTNPARRGSSTPTVTSRATGSGPTHGTRHSPPPTSASTSPHTDCATRTPHGCSPAGRISWWSRIDSGTAPSPQPSATCTRCPAVMTRRCVPWTQSGDVSSHLRQTESRFSPTRTART
jgi:integrase